MTTFNPYPEDEVLLGEIGQKTAIMETLRSGRFSDGRGLSDVFHEGVVACLAEIAASWTPEHEAMLRAGLTSRRAMSEAAVAAARAEGFGPGTAQDRKIAKAVELHGKGVLDELLAGLFGVSRQKVGWWVQRAEAAAASGEDRKAAEARRLYGEDVPVRQIATRLGVSWQKAASWCHKAPATPPDRKARARSRSAGNGAVKHATPVTFLAPEAKP